MSSSTPDLQGAPGGWTAAALTELIYETVRSELLAVGPEFTPKSNLIESGLDSLAVTQLLLTIQEQTGLWLDESKLTPENLATCEVLARCIHAELQAS